MRQAIKDFVAISAETLPFKEPIYEFGSFQVPAQEGFADLRPLFSGKEYVSTDMYERPGVDKVLDLHEINLPSQSMGTILCLDTLEHVEYPHRALEQMYRILKPDGLLIISSVMLWPIHDHPYDYWRFTPEAFRSLLRPFAYSFVGFAGEELFPHTVVGIGFKKFPPQLSEFKRKYADWQTQNLVQVIGQNWQSKYLVSVNYEHTPDQQLASRNGLSSKEQVLEALTTQIAEKEQTNQILSSSLSNKERELQEIYRSKAWRLIQFLRRVRLGLLPPGSTREHIAQSILNVYRAFSHKRSSPNPEATTKTTSAIETSVHFPQAPAPDPIVIHQMGKVGSKTIELSLQETYQALGVEVPIYHIHILNDFDNLEKQAFQERLDPADFLSAIDQGRNLRKQIDDNPAQHWNLITLVRDPIARNVGTFFHNLPDFIPDWHARYTDGKLDISELQELLLSIDSIKGWPEYWFDAQLKSIPAFGIDVYAELFPHEVGYKIYPGMAQARLLLLRLEDLHRCAEAAMREFLGLDHFTLHNTNIGEEKAYADLYRAFKNQPLPIEYVQVMYGTTFARHFYTEAELLAFAKRWTQIQDLKPTALSQNSL